MGILSSSLLIARGVWRVMSTSWVLRPEEHRRAMIMDIVIGTLPPLSQLIECRRRFKCILVAKANVVTQIGSFKVTVSIFMKESDVLLPYQSAFSIFVLHGCGTLSLA